MSVIKQLYDKTEAMYERFQELKLDDKNRETLIEEFTDFLDERDDLLNQVSDPTLEGDQKLGQALVEVDQKLQALANQYFNTFKSDWGMFKQKKANNTKYINPYQNLYGRDGAYLDQKK